MLPYLMGIFFLLHGAVFLLYFGQSQRLFELRPGMIWPDDSWAFERLLGQRNTRRLASITLVLSAAGFIIGGIGTIFKLPWWHSAILFSAAFSSIVILLFWDGKLQKLDDQGGIGLLINLILLVTLLIFDLPTLGF